MTHLFYLLLALMEAFLRDEICIELEEAHVLELDNAQVPTHAHTPKPLA